MKLNDQHKQYIKQHELDIREGNWEKFFEHEKYPQGIGEPLYLAKIPFMQELGYIPRVVFSYCMELTSVNIPSGVMSISPYAFYDCFNLTSVTISASVKNIGEYAFYGCDNLTAVEFGSNSQLTSIGPAAFKNCRGLTSISIPAGVTSIGECAFYDCTWLTSVSIPDSVTEILDGAFSELSEHLVINYEGTKEQWEQIYNRKAFINTDFTVNWR